MRVASLLAVFIFVALASAAGCEAQRRSPAAIRAAEAPWFLEAAEAPRPARFQVPAGRPRSWQRHVAVGMAIGGAAGLVWGLTRTPADENVFGLSPVIETAIGAGVGFYAGTAVYLVRSIRRQPRGD